MRLRTIIGATLFGGALGALACSSDPEAPNTTGGGSSDTNCEGRGETFFSGMKKSTADGQITAEIVAADPAPPANADSNTWTVKLTSSTGDTIPAATIVGTLYMVDHKHGAPSGLSSELGAGSYTLGPLAMRMAGLWTVTLRITASGSTEEKDVVFSFCIPHD